MINGINLQYFPISISDQMGEICTLASKPIRIISLVPSQTELLFDLGLVEEVVGITKFCTDPANKVKNVRKVGGTKKFNLDVIAELKPDLIIGNKEENYEEGINQLKQHYPVWMSDIVTLDDALKIADDFTIKNPIGIVKQVQACSEALVHRLKDHAVPRAVIERMQDYFVRLI